MPLKLFVIPELTQGPIGGLAGVIKGRTNWRQVGRFVLDEGPAKRVIRLAGLRLFARSSAADGAQTPGRSQPDRWPFRPSFRGVAAATNPESRDSGFDAWHRPGMTVFIDMTSVSP